MNRGLVVFVGALALDLALGELPNRGHPVAWLGRGIAAADGRLPHRTGRQQLISGLILATAFPGAAIAAAIAVRRSGRSLPAPAGLAIESLALTQAFAVRALFAHIGAVRRPLDVGDLPAARHAASRIVSRDTAALAGPAIASAAIESLAENLSDSAVAPWFWYALGGLPAAFAYRAVNTLDAMVGYRHRGLRGTPSARLDDVLNYIPARLTALAIALAAGRRAAFRGCTWAADAGRTPSPNSGWPMAFAAHALGLRLEKRGHHILNSAGRDPEAADVRVAEWLMARALVLVGGAMLAALSRREVSR